MKLPQEISEAIEQVGDGTYHFIGPMSTLHVEVKGKKISRRGQNIPLRKDVVRGMASFSDIYIFEGDSAFQTFGHYLENGIVLRQDGNFYRLATARDGTRPIVSVYASKNGRERILFLEAPDGRYTGTEHQIAQHLIRYYGTRVFLDPSLHPDEIKHFKNVTKW